MAKKKQSAIDKLLGRNKPEPEPEHEKPPVEEFMEIGGSPGPGITLLQVLRGHTDTINRIAWSPDGRYLASPSDDRTVRIWDTDRMECIKVLNGHDSIIQSVAWSPDSSFIACCGAHNFYIWDIKNLLIIEKVLQTGSYDNNVAWSPDGKFVAHNAGKHLRIIDVNNQTTYFETELQRFIYCIAWKNNRIFAISGDEGYVELWDAVKKVSIGVLKGHNEGGLQITDSEKFIGSGQVNSIVWMPNSYILVSGGDDGTVRVWNTDTMQLSTTLEGHTNRVVAVTSSYNGKVIASKGIDHSVRLINSHGWNVIGRFFEYSEAYSFCQGLAFHPHKPILASLGNRNIAIRIWHFEFENLLTNEESKESIRYTTAKLVLVGDSGVGKTGLGWRLAHNAFKEHSSTHGQQFWVVPELKKTRSDGTECEAVLWDLAGQHIYRSIHSIFLDDVDASLVLFDPTNRQDPLKGAQFWLEQLKGKKQLPPSVLVGARLDRGAPVLSQQELEQFCQKYGISGGYIGTSAKSGEGLDTLLERLKGEIPWDQMTTTVTTVTFKRIKEYVLKLKEKPDRKGVLVRPDDLRKQLQATDKDWEFTDAEMMTAVGHLANHGYVTILKSSSGEQFILLVPELLASVASSVFLIADKHPRELGAINETELLQGKYPIDEFKGLEKEEQQVLLDATVVRFLQHSLCFRETLGNDNLLIFPSLIKQKRPLQDDIQSTDDMSYIVRGRVENIYASLVVLLGYTSSFTRINQWANQAQYVMGEGEICGFRLIEEREGELELILYYSATMPTYGRSMFQGLFEKFLYQRDVTVTRFPPVSCSNGHVQQRASVMNMIHDGETSMFCAKCGKEITLPELDKPVAIGARILVQVDEEGALAHLRNTYETYLARIKSFRRDRVAPSCYVSYVDEQSKWVESLIHDLRDAGIVVVEDRAQVKNSDFVIVIGTPDYPDALKKTLERIVLDIPLIRSRIPRVAGQKSMLAPLLLEGNGFTAFPHELRSCMPGDFRIDSKYVVSLFDLVMTLYAIPFDQPAFEPLRKNLSSQWEETLNKKKELPQQGVYISYAWGGESEEIVNELDDIFHENGVTIIRDKRDLGYKGRIKAFMEIIGKGKAVILVISEKYLKSENCMFELLQVAKHGQFTDRIFPIVLEDAKIYSPIDRIRYVKDWEQKISELDKEIRSIGAANLHGFRDDIDLYTEIRANLPRLAEILKDMNTLSAKIHRETGYQQLFDDVVTKLEE